jgi:hypothetical protein
MSSEILPFLALAHIGGGLLIDVLTCGTQDEYILPERRGRSLTHKEYRNRNGKNFYQKVKKKQDRKNKKSM